MRITSIIIFLFILSNYVLGQYQIPASVFGDGSGEISNTNFRISATIGQTSIGQVQAGNFKKWIGFWRPAQILTPVEGLVDIIPFEYRLDQNYPNPFNPSTIIEYQIPEVSNVTLKVYDILGREVAALVNGDKSEGIYNVQFSTSNYQLSSGIYYYRIEAKSKVSDKHFTKVGKMVLLK